MSHSEFPKLHKMKQSVNPSAIVGLSVLLVMVTAPHAAEDFAYGVFMRFGISDLAAGLVLAVAYGLQTYGAYLSGRGVRSGSAILGIMGAVWCVGALAIHGREILSTGNYRHGFISKALEVLIIAVGALTAVVGLSQRGRE
jgi:hypothetical protein